LKKAYFNANKLAKNSKKKTIFLGGISGKFLGTKIAANQKMFYGSA
jgi:hypothetical protein